MRLPSRLAVAVRRGARAAAAYPAAFVRELRWFLTDDAARTALLYVLALCFAATSVVLYFLGDAGSPTRIELVLQLGSLGVFLYVSIRQAGHAPRRGPR